MRLIIARHGQTQENVEKRIQGQGIDSLLNKAGLAQVKKLADRLKKEEINIVYSSDLQRAVHTAKEVARFHPLVNIVLTPHLRERNLGIYEGEPSIYLHKDIQKSTLSFADYKPAGGESFFELYDRVEIFFNGILKKHKNDTVLLVAHGGVCTILLLKLFDKQITQENCNKYKIDNASVTILDFYDNKPHKVYDINNITHLN